VSAIKKLFLAAALIGAGLGVAYLLGEPAALQQVVRHARPTRVASDIAPQSSPATNAGLASSSVRLLPESRQDTAGPSTAALMVSPPALLPDSQLISIAAAPISPRSDADPYAVGTAAVNSSALNTAEAMPRARLRREAPRPIGNEPRSPATIRRAPSVQAESSGMVRESGAETIPAAWSSSPQLLPTGYASTGAPAPAATYNAPASLAIQSSDTSVPWSAEDPENGPRTHFVVDGDSLQKLAGRYLSDPNRSAEIYDLNRELLSNPDLLPIGAELKIPDRNEQTSWNRESQRHETLGATALREASRLMPLRPISHEEHVAPQARLTAPLAID